MEQEIFTAGSDICSKLLKLIDEGYFIDAIASGPTAFSENYTIVAHKMKRPDYSQIK